MWAAVAVFMPDSTQLPANTKSGKLVWLKVPFLLFNLSPAFSNLTYEALLFVCAACWKDKNLKSDENKKAAKVKLQLPGQLNRPLGK